MFQTRQGGLAWGDKVYRGQKFGVTRIDAGYKADWFLVPKGEESEFCQITSVLPKKEKPPTHFDCPPLLELFTQQELEQEGKLPPTDYFKLKLTPHTVNKAKQTVQQQ